MLTSASNALIVEAPDADNLKIRIEPASGLFKGTFVYPGQTKPTDFGGALFQDQTLGAGFFVGPGGSGQVSLSP
jgi:hypothetical protein